MGEIKEWKKIKRKRIVRSIKGATKFVGQLKYLLLENGFFTEHICFTSNSHSWWAEDRFTFYPCQLVKSMFSY